MKRFLLAVFRFVYKTIFFIVALFLFVSLVLYIWAPIYHFPEPKPFSGKNWHNPYQHLDTLNWKRANFHGHTNAWGKVADGKKTTIDDILRVYGKELNYDIYSISNYQKITIPEGEEATWIPGYEHGFSLKKAHHVIIGADKVVWYDLPFFQSTHHKQYILNQLKGHSDIVVIAHPGFRNGFNTHDFEKLGNYDLFEVLNNFITSSELWDVALSSGHKAYLLADDDVHNFTNTNETGRKFTMIHVSTTERKEVTSALKAGHSYGVDLKLIDQEPLANKRKRIDSLPVPKFIKLAGDTLWAMVGDTNTRYRFIGQKGKVLAEINGEDSVSYILKPEDTYVRVTAMLADSTFYFFNPVIRYDKTVPENISEATINQPITWVLRSIGTIILIIFFFSYFKRRRRNARKARRLRLLKTTPRNW